MNELQALSFEEMQSYAEHFAASALFKDTRDMEKAFVKIAAGQELGIPPFASMAGIHIVEGKPTLSANLLAALVRRTGIYDFDVVELTDEVCRLRFYRLVIREGQSRELGESVFGRVDAETAEVQLTYQSGAATPWKKYPRNMMYARALSNGVKWYCPEIASGMPIYHHEEMGLAVDENDNVIDVEMKPAAKPMPVKKAAPKKAAAKAPAKKVIDAEPPKINGEQMKRLTAVIGKVGFTGSDKDKATLAAFMNHYNGRVVAGVRDLTGVEAETIISDTELSGKLADFVANQQLQEAEQ